MSKTYKGVDLKNALKHYGRPGMKKGRHLPGTTWWQDGFRSDQPNGFHSTKPSSSSASSEPTQEEIDIFVGTHGVEPEAAKAIIRTLKRKQSNANRAQYENQRKAAEQASARSSELARDAVASGAAEYKKNMAEEEALDRKKAAEERKKRRRMRHPTTVELPKIREEAAKARIKRIEKQIPWFNK